MQINIINRKGADSVKFYEIDVSMSKLICALWNLPELDHSKLFRKENPQAHMTESQADEKLKSITKKENGEFAIDVEFIKHDKARKYLGVILKGTKDNDNITWHEITIDQATYLKHRKEYKPNQTLDKLMVQLSRESIQRSAHSKSTIIRQPSLIDDLRPDNPIDTISINTNANTKPEEEKKPSLMMQMFKSPILHGTLTAALSGIGLFFARVSTAVMVGVSLGAGLLTWAAESFYFWRKRAFQESYQDYGRMSPKALASLDDSTKSALQTGLEANAWGSWTKSAFNLNAWKNYKAYGAGLIAAKQENDPLAQNILKAKA